MRFERWSLLVVRELSTGSTRFSEIHRGVPLMSRTLLSQRLGTLRDAGIIEPHEGRAGPEYTLTEAGQALRPILEAIGVWGKRYVESDLRDDRLDPRLLMWDMQRRLHVDRLPKERTVVLFRFADARKGQRRFWMCVSADVVDLCLTDPGFGVDLTVDTDVRTLTEVWLGTLTLAACVRDRTVLLTGPTSLKRAFPSWLALSVFAGAG